MRRSRVKVGGSAVTLLFLGGCGWFAGSHKDRIFIEIGSMLLTAYAVALLLSLLWSLTIDVDKAGLTLRSRGVTTRLPWDSVVALSVERKVDDWTRPGLWLQVAPGVRIKRLRAVDRHGREAYLLIDLDDLTHPPEMAIALLKEQRADKVDAEDYLGHLATKRLVSDLLKEADAEAARERPTE